MPKTKYPIFKCMHRGEKGFTLIELLIVIAILGVIGAVVALNVGGFMGAGELEAANTEASTVKTSVMGYMVDADTTSIVGTVGPTGTVLPEDYAGTGAEALDVSAYMEQPSLKATYTIDTSEDCIITAATATATGWSSAIGWGGTGGTAVFCKWGKL